MLRSLSQTEHQNFLAAVKTIEDFDFSHSYLNNASTNLAEFHDQVHIEAQRHLGSSLAEYHPPSYRAELNRRLMNALMAFNLVENYLCNTTKKLYGQASSEFTRLRKLQNDAYDTQFAYRFAYLLRNYIAHRGYPITRFGYSASGDAVSVEVAINTAHLLSSSFPWKRVKRDLQERREVEVGPVLDEAFQVHVQAQILVSTFSLPAALSAASVLEDLVGTHLGQPGHLVVGQVVPGEGAGDKSREKSINYTSVPEVSLMQLLNSLHEVMSRKPTRSSTAQSG